MSIYYVSNLIEKDKFEMIYTKALKPGQQIQKFNNLILKGLLSNDQDVVCISVIPTSRAIIDRFIIRLNSNNNFTYISSFNISGVKDILTYFKTKMIISKIIKNDKNAKFIVDVLSPTNAYITSKIAKANKIDCVGIVTDLPEFVTKSNIFNKISYLTLKNCNKYVFLTEAMNEKVNVSNKRYCIVDGVADFEFNTFNNNPRDNIVMYAGSLDKANGINNLVEAFKTIKNSTLEIYGNGDYQNQIVEVTKEYSNIKYFGVKPNSYIVKRLQEVKLLVNPRPTSEDFVKYSFPSKTLEYMASGTPFISTKLPGISEEYFKYIFAFEDFGVDTIRETIIKILTMDELDLLDKAKKAQCYALNNKNNIKQTKKIIDLIKGD